MDPSWAVTKKKMESIPGWLSTDEGFALWSAARSRCQIPNQHSIAVEIGSYQGKSSVCIAAGLDIAGTLFCIDPFNDTPLPFYQREGFDLLAGFQQHTKNYGNIVPQPGLSTIIGAKWNVPLDFLFIDGDHSYDAVAADLATWVPRLKPGAILAMHDVRLPWEGGHDVDPIRVVCDLGIGRPECGWVSTTRVDSLLLTIRTGDPWKLLA